jgi:hypothetical protein
MMTTAESTAATIHTQLINSCPIPKSLEKLAQVCSKIQENKVGYYVNKNLVLQCFASITVQIQDV